MTDRCNDCGLCKYGVPCIPKGTDHPEIYFVGEAPGPEEKKVGTPFIGPAGRYLHDLISVYGLNENNCRFFNIVRCYPQISDDNPKFRAPSKDEINACMHYFIEDINNTKPKVIVTLGNTPAKALFEDLKSGVTSFRGEIKEYNGFLVVPTLHPSYLMRQQDNQKIRMEFKSDIKLAMDICLDQEKYRNSSRQSSFKKDNESSTKLCLSYSDFNNFCIDQIDSSEDIGYDVETNAKEVHNANHEVVGFSLASNKDFGCYVPIKSLDFKMPDVDRRLIEKRLSRTLSSEDKTVTVYNCQHEYPATLNWLGVELPNVDDIFVMVKLMMGNADQYKGNGGLKAQSVMNLGYKDWSADLDRYFSYLLDYENKKDDMKDLLLQYYEESEIEDLLSKVEDVYFNELVSRSSNDTLSYEYVPYKLIGRYGSIDSSVLFELKSFYDDWMNREGETLGIDLHKGYRYWMMHHYCGYTLERNGAYWNDKKAQEIEDWCNEGMSECIKQLIISPLSEPYLKDKLYPMFLEYIKDNHIAEILGKDFTPKRLYKSSVDVVCNTDEGKQRLARMSIYSKKNKKGEDTGVYKLQMGNIEFLGKKFLFDNKNMFEEWYKKYMEEYSSEKHTLSDHKRLLNPNATSQEYRAFVSDLLLTEKVRYAKLYMNILQITEEPGYDIDYYKDFFNIDKGIIDNSPKRNNRYFSISEFKESNGDRYEFRDTDDSKLLSLVHKLSINGDMSPSSRFDMFMKFMSSDRDFKEWKIKKQIDNAALFKLESLDSGVMNEVYDLYLMCHIDVEDNTTWNERFKWLFYYKLFKKYSKLISTYINGKIGRNNVYLVDKNSYSSGDYFTKRDSLYNKEENSKYEDKAMMLQADFRVNMADTGRWQAGIHNLPAGEAIKSIYTSRFPGGCISMPDGSQMEVRTLAAECGDENLLKAFRDGVDIHRFFASKIYRVPYDDVESWQRGLAKNAVFGMIYGESEKAFADIYLKGDLNQAKQIFNDMFTGFPKIKEYIERAQSQYQKFSKVTTITQRFINLNDPRIDHNTMLRRSQNYPIQAAAEDLAGIIMYKLVEFLKENNMKSKPFCFIHDSIEIDMHPYEVFPLIDKIKYLFNVYPLEEFGVPVACDVPLGPSMGQECEVEEMEHDDDYNNVVITLGGFIDDIEELVGIWRTVYKVVELVDEEEFKSKDKESYVSYADMFLPKKAKVSMKMGTMRYKGSRKIKIIVK